MVLSLGPINLSFIVHSKKGSAVYAHYRNYISVLCCLSGKLLSPHKWWIKHATKLQIVLCRIYVSVYQALLIYNSGKFWCIIQRYAWLFIHPINHHSDNNCSHVIRQSNRGLHNIVCTFTVIFHWRDLGRFSGGLWYHAPSRLQWYQSAIYVTVLKVEGTPILCHDILDV